MWTSDFYWYGTCIYLQKAGISKHSWKKIKQLLRTVVTYLLKKKNAENEIEHDTDSSYGVSIH